MSTQPAPVQDRKDSTDQSAASASANIDKATSSFLRLGLVALLAGGIGMSALILVFHGDQWFRLGGPLTFVVTGLLAAWVLRLGHTRACLMITVYGSWCAVTSIMFVSGGVNATTVIGYPLIIVMAGWVLGTRTAFGLATASSLAVFVVAVLGDMGALIRHWPTSPFMFWLADTVVFLLSAAVVLSLRRSHQSHLEEVRGLSAALERERLQVGAAEDARRVKALLDRTGHLAHVGGWELDIATQRLVWTDETFRIHDLPPGEMPTLEDAIAFYAPEARESIAVAVRQAIEEGISYDLELPLVTATGRSIWVRALGEAHSEDGRVVRLSGAFQDITKHRLADEELKASLNNLQRTLESTDDGIFGYDGTDPSGRLLFANDRFFEIWRMDGATVENTTRADIIAAARALFPDPDAGVKRIEDILAMGVAHEDKVALNDGRILFRRSVPLLAESQVSRVWSFRDITAEERAKVALQASRDEAERANAAKSEFLSRMSHELRTPLHGMLGMTQLAQRRMQDERGQGYLANAEKAALHLLALINDVLDISKIEAGHLEVEKVDFKLDDVLHKLLTLVGNSAEEKGVTLHLEQDGLGPGAFHGDPLRLGQVLLNLVGNAIKFSRAGKVTIRIHPLPPPGKQGLRFEIEDQGIGIQADKIERLFVPFEQVDGSTTRNYGGTGLGLAISKRLVQLMGGEIGVESTPGKGSRFWFTVGLTLAARSGSGSESGALSVEARLKSEFSGAKILLADDEAMGRQVTEEILTEAGLSVDTAGDGAEALAKARLAHYDLILMDMRMPVMNGLEATREIRAGSLNMSTPVIAITANAFESDRIACLEAGMEDHIGKPISSEMLYITVLHWLSQRVPES